MVSRYCISSGSLPGRDWLTKALGNEKEEEEEKEEEVVEKEEEEEEEEKEEEKVEDRSE